MSEESRSDWRVRVIERPNIVTYPPRATFGPRLATSWEFVWLLEGRAVYQFEGLEKGEIELAVGQLLLCRPGERDQFSWNRDKRTRHGYFHFELQSNPERSSQWPRVREMAHDDLFNSLLRHLLTGSEGGEASQRDLAAGLLLAAFVNGQSRVGDVPPQQAPEPVERAMNWLFSRLEEEPGTPISLEALSRAAFVSPEHLCRLFKTTTDHSPLEVVRLARLDRAALLLARTNFAIGEIAHLTGFASQFHFSRAFKHAYNLSPRELRKNLERGEAMPLPRLVRVWRP